MAKSNSDDVRADELRAETVRADEARTDKKHTDANNAAGVTSAGEAHAGESRTDDAPTSGAPAGDIDENYVIASPKKKPKASARKERASQKKDNPKKPTSRKRLITCGVVIVVVLAVAGVGFWKWHETPSFCGAICHSPMDPYLPTYYSEPGNSGTDKWGNAVSDSSSMLSATHREYADMGCMGCHIPSIQEQVTEGLEWVVGNYYNPLNERDLSRLVYYRGVGETEFCLNSSCHNMTKDDLTDATSESVRNPHSWHHSEYDCSDCHKAHRASVMVCSQCHEDYTLPDGWITYQESKELETIYGQYSDFEGAGSQ